MTMEMNLYWSPVKFRITFRTGILDRIMVPNVLNLYWSPAGSVWGGEHTQQAQPVGGVNRFQTKSAVRMDQVKPGEPVFFSRLPGTPLNGTGWDSRPFQSTHPTAR